MHRIGPLVVLMVSWLAYSSPGWAKLNCQDIAGTRTAPWEITDGCGQSYVANIFYAEPSQNKQIASLRIQDRYRRLLGLEPKVQIERLIYPTVGNPNLVVGYEGNGIDEPQWADDKLVFVLRLEQEAIAHIVEGRQTAPDEFTRQSKQGKQSLVLNQQRDKSQNDIRFYLVKRGAKAPMNTLPGFGGSGIVDEVEANRLSLVNGQIPMGVGDGVIQVTPSHIIEHKTRGYPDEFKSRRTLEVVFEGQTLRDLVAANTKEPNRPDLYDIRFEVLKNGTVTHFEYQYNSVAVINRSTPKDYTVLNVTDSQVSVNEKVLNREVIAPLREKTFKNLTHRELKEFVDYLARAEATAPDQADSVQRKIHSAPFITFNGDLHNGGSPSRLLPEEVTDNYRQETEAIVDILMELPKPIFLTAGNHDGDASMGHAPSLFNTGFKGKTMDQVVAEIQDDPLEPKPEILEHYRRYIGETENNPGGHHVDVVVGTYVRRTTGTNDWKVSYKTLSTRESLEKGESFDRVPSWEPVPESKRNLVLYDGFHYWRTAYGPLYTSWTYGDNFYLNFNSYDCRQHRRAGWGMYTVNYGGCVSGTQMLWIENQLNQSKQIGADLIAFAHHDPRGGHGGKDYPYYFKQIDYMGMGASAINYVNGEFLVPTYCKMLPDFAKKLQPSEAALSCLHDGLQEWMRPDPKFDCKLEETIAEEDGLGRECNLRLFTKLFDKIGNVADESENGDVGVDMSQVNVYRHPRYTGYELINHLAENEHWRTLVLGHTHFNSIQVLQGRAEVDGGDPLVPDELILGGKSNSKYQEFLDGVGVGSGFRNPARSISRYLQRRGWGPQDMDEDMTAKIEQLSDEGIKQETYEQIKVAKINFEEAGHGFTRHVQGENRDLAIIRLTSITSMTSQKVDGETNNGFSLLDVNIPRSEDDPRNYQIAQVNRIHFIKNEPEGDEFQQVGTHDLVRWSTYFNAPSDAPFTYGSETAE